MSHIRAGAWIAVAVASTVAAGCDTLTGLKHDLRREGAAVLRLQVVPSTGLVVRVDGEAVAAAPLGDLVLAPGAHRVEIEAPGHHPFAFPVELKPGETLSIPVALRAVASPPPAAAPAPP